MLTEENVFTSYDRVELLNYGPRLLKQRQDKYVRLAMWFISTILGAFGITRVNTPKQPQVYVTNTRNV